MTPSLLFLWEVIIETGCTWISNDIKHDLTDQKIVNWKKEEEPSDIKIGDQETEEAFMALKTNYVSILQCMLAWFTENVYRTDTSIHTFYIKYVEVCNEVLNIYLMYKYTYISM